MEPASLIADFRIPKLEVSAAISLLAHPQKEVKLFLHECSGTHAGAERPSDLLNGSREFFPAVEPSGKTVFLHREAVTVVSVPVESEFPPEEPGENPLEPEPASRLPVEVVVQGGTVIRGTVSFVGPEGRNRLIDFLNMPDRFLVVREEGLARLINKRRIVRVTVI